MQGEHAHPAGKDGHLMPWRPKKACAGCGKPTEGRFCPPCRSKHNRQVDQVRGTASERGYGVDWQALRKLVLKRDPTCKKCNERKSSHADHKVPKRLGGTDDPSNLQGLCFHCHNSVKQSEERRQ